MLNYEEDTAEILEDIYQRTINANIGEENETEYNTLTSEQFMILVFKAGMHVLTKGSSIDIVYNEETNEWKLEELI